MKSNLKTSLFLLFLFTLLHSHCLQAQGYVAIRAQAEFTYLNSQSGNFLAIRIDSIRMDMNGTRYYNFMQLKPNDYGCYDLQGSWLGDQIMEEPDGCFNFEVYPFSLSDSNEVYRILTKSAVGTPWTFYNYHTINHHIEAKVTAIEWRTFAGLSDSVKIISLTRKDAAGQLISDPVNSQTILLSKTYGLIRLPKFDTFTDYPEFYDLSGKTNPETGIINLTALKIFDYQPGDEFHSVMHAEDFVYNAPKYTISTITKILERTDNPDLSVSYKIDRCTSSYYWYADTSTSYSYRHDTIYLQYSEDDFPFLNSEPLQPAYYTPYWIIKPYMGFLDDPDIPITDVPYKAYNVLEAWFKDDFCYHAVMIDGCNYANLYFKGLGGPYFDCRDLGYGHSYNLLQYYKKGEISWGTPLNCDSLFHVGISESATLPFFGIHPNPAKSVIWVTTPPGSQAGKLEIVDLSGRKVACFVQHETRQCYDISGLPAGIYGYVYHSAEGEIYRGKIIRQ